MPRPIMLAVVGDSAAGKTTLTEGIARLLGPQHVVTVCTDDYHRYNRRQRKELGISAL
ncbi:MAG: phosphoribulokinase, partial [Caldilineae bacterium]